MTLVIELMFAKALIRFITVKTVSFSELVKFDPANATGNLQVLLRFTDDWEGNGHVDDQLSKIYATNDGWFDQTGFDGQQVHVTAC